MAFVKLDQDDAQEAFLPKSSDDISALENDSQGAKPSSIQYWRLSLEIFMAAIIVVLLTSFLLDQKHLKPSPVPDCMSVTGYLTVD
jgi:hypothetical protein